MADNKNRSIRLVKAGGRRVTRDTTEYDWNALEKRAAAERAQKKKTRSETDLERRVRYQKRQKQKRLKMQRVRAIVILVLTVVTVSVLLFMTPIFNIRSVTVEGNSLVSVEEYQEMLKPLVGENIFRNGERKIEKILKANPFIDAVNVRKKIVPPTVAVAVREFVPAGMLRAEGKTLLVSSRLNVLSDDGNMITPVPIVSGISVNGEVGKIAKSDEEEKKEVVLTALQTLEKTGVLDKVTEINVSDLTDITINYDNRLTVSCGTQLDLERKLRLFRETVTNNYFAENARGTIKFTDGGKAVYTP